MGINCNHPTCNGICRRPQKEKKQYHIPKVAKNRIIVDRLYNAAAKIYREKHKFCRINSPVCTKATEGVHHLKGKATTELLLNQLYWMPACNACNGYVEDHSAWAFSNGYKLSKFS
jgi:hypothetical protein